MTTKSAFRSRCRQFRTETPAAELESRGASILRRLEDLPEFAAAQTVHIYWPLTEAGEVDTRPIIDRLHRAGRRVVLPVIDGESSADREMQHREYGADTPLQMNTLGIQEPQGGKTVPIDEIDLVIVPALGADRMGHRVGYGGGYYDRFLAGVAVPTVALVYQECMTDTFDSEAHDVPVTIVLTETETIRPADRQDHAGNSTE